MTAMITGGRLAMAATALLLITAMNATARPEERIRAFESTVSIQPDASLIVTERITVYAGGDRIKRGIFRDFPTLYGKWHQAKKKVAFDVLEVARNSQPEPHVLENIDRGQRLRIGNANVFLPEGEHVYEITYRTDRQLGYFDEHDELYWNATGNFWEFPIDRATARVELPGGARALSYEAYTGPEGAKSGDYSSHVDAAGAVFFATTRGLKQREGLTVVVTFPKGTVAEGATGWKAFAQDNPGIAWAMGGLFCALLYYLVAWLLVGVDPPKGVIFPHYDAPKGFSAAAVRTLDRMGFDDLAFSAGVIALAVKGALQIQETSKNDFKLVKIGEPDNLTPDEWVLFKNLLGSRKTLRLKQSNHKSIGKAKKALGKALATKLEKTHFVKNLRYWMPGFLISLAAIAMALRDANAAPPALFLLFWLSFWTIGTTALASAAISAWKAGQWGGAIGKTLFSIPFVAGWCFGATMLGHAAGLPVVGIFVICMLLNLTFYHLIKAPTHMGRKVLDQIEGLKEYLSVAEEERLNLINPPEQTPQLFEKFLPFALALDVDQAWSEKFSDVLEAAATSTPEGSTGYRPNWYSGVGNSSLSGLSRSSFASSLGSAMTSSLSSSSTAPGSSSGSGGGGSSGGGGGGGGGGGW